MAPRRRLPPGAYLAALLSAATVAWTKAPTFIGAPGIPGARPSSTRTCLRQGPPPDGSNAAGKQLMKFGKYKDKESFEWVCQNQQGYVTWVTQNCADKGWAQSFLSYVRTRGGKASPAPKVSRGSVRSTPQKASLRPSPSPQPKAAAAKPATRTVPSASRARPSLRTAPSASRARPSQRTSGRAASKTPSKTPSAAELNADFFELPRGLLDGKKLWSCQGKAESVGEMPWAFSLRTGWTFVGRVVLGRRLGVNFQDSEALPNGDCKLMEESDLTELEYARFIGALMQEAGRNQMAPAREIIVKGTKMEALPKYRFRGVLLDGRAYVAPALEQELYAPEARHLGGNKRTAMASMIGLKVRPLGPAQPWFTGLVVCEPEDKNNITLTQEIKDNLLRMTKTRPVKDATAKALVDELLLTVSKNCTNERDLKMTFTANALRPCLSGQDQEQRLRRVAGWEGFQAVPPTAMLLEPSLRQKMIAEEVDRVSARLFSDSNLRPLRLAGQEPFRKLVPPELVLGKRLRVSGADKPGKALMTFNRAGPYAVQPSPPVRVAVATFGGSQPLESFAPLLLLDIKKGLKQYGLDVAQDSPEPLHVKGTSGDDVRAALRSDSLRRADAVLLIGGRISNDLYNSAKYECLTSVNDVGRHVANQWFDFSKSSLWRPGTRSLEFAEKICVVGLMAKLGHAPWAIDVQRWFRGPESEYKDLQIGVVGYDVCHFRNPQDPKKRTSIAAGIRVESQPDSDPLLLSRITSRMERVPAETVPLKSLKDLIPADFARGKLLIVHRDGEFPYAELDSLRKYHKEILADEIAATGRADTAFVLVECVKWAGGSPRLYQDSRSAEAGSMMSINDEEVLLASSKDLFQGTANPINVRLAGVIGKVPDSFALDEFAWVQSVFDLSYLHHGSAMRRPRLPVTTHFADRLAYMLSALGKDGSDFDREMKEASGGTEQFWL